MLDEISHAHTDSMYQVCRSSDTLPNIDIPASLTVDSAVILCIHVT